MEDYIKIKCPKCKNIGLDIVWSPCYDWSCCGIMDRIECEDLDCEFEIEGYFEDYKEKDFIKLVIKE